MSEIVTIVNLQHAASRIWTCAEPEFRLSWIKICSSDNHYTTALCLLHLSLHRKPFFFFQTSWKDGLSKNNLLEYDLSCIIRRDDFFFLENMILPYRRKMRDDLSQKIHINMIFSSNVLKRWSFQKGLRWNLIFLILSGKMVFFFSKTWYFFPWEESEGRSFSRITWEYEIFCVHLRALQTWLCAPLSKKIKDHLIPKKYTRMWLAF